MNKKEERDNFWISVGPESGYLGTIAEETARKNDGGISPDGQRLGWKNACDDSERHRTAEVLENPCDYNCPPFCFGEDCPCPPTNYHKEDDDDDIATRFPYGDPCDCGADCNRAIDRSDCPCGEDCNCESDKTDCQCGEGCNCEYDALHHACSADCARDFGAQTFAQDSSASGGVTVGYTPIFGANCDCSTLPLPGMIPVEAQRTVPPADRGPEHQNTEV